MNTQNVLAPTTTKTHIPHVFEQAELAGELLLVAQLPQPGLVVHGRPAQPSNHARPLAQLRRCRHAAPNLKPGHSMAIYALEPAQMPRTSGNAAGAPRISGRRILADSPGRTQTGTPSLTAGPIRTW